MLFTSALLYGLPLQDSLIKITGDNYLSVVSRFKRVAILFYDSHCHTSHCKHVYFDFVEAALSERTSSIAHHSKRDLSQTNWWNTLWQTSRISGMPTLSS